MTNRQLIACTLLLVLLSIPLAVVTERECRAIYPVRPAPLPDGELR